MKKTFFLMVGALALSLSWQSQGRPLTSKAIRFDINKLRNGIKPTLFRMADEMCILIGNLFKRHELDEVNQRSLIRIRGYLADIYHNPTVTPRLKKRIYMAIRQITAELENRVAFEARYAAGLVASAPPLPQALQSAMKQSQISKFKAAGRKIMVANRFKSRMYPPPPPPPPPPPLPLPRQIKNAGSRNAAMGDAFNVRKNRGRRLYNLIQSGYLREGDLKSEDKTLLNTYRRQMSGAGPRPPTASKRRSMPPKRRPSQPLRSDNILRSVEQQIDRRISTRQIDPQRRDPRDYRDQIQGATDEEWAAS